MKDPIIGRVEIQDKLRSILRSNKAEFVSVYGRKNVGKTHLLTHFFQNQDCFFLTIAGLPGASMSLERDHFAQIVQRKFYSGVAIKKPRTWAQIFDLLAQGVSQQVKSHPVVILLDRVSVLSGDDPRFVHALSDFWKNQSEHYPNLKLLICDVADSWFITHFIDISGEAHQNITQQIVVEPLSVDEIKTYLLQRGVDYTDQQIAELHKMTGGIPKYLENYSKDVSKDSLNKLLQGLDLGVPTLMLMDGVRIHAGLPAIVHPLEELLDIIEWVPQTIQSLPTPIAVAFSIQQNDLPDRNYFEKTLQQIIKRSSTISNAFAVVYLQLQNLTALENTLNPQAMATLLSELIQRVNRCIQPYDYFASLSDNRFGIILQDILSPYDAGVISKNILRELHEICNVQGHHVNLEAKIGIGCYPQAGEDYVTLTQAAAEAVQQAQSGEYQFVVPSFSDRCYQLNKVEHNIQSIMDKQGLSLVYQPQFDLNTKKILGIEAFLRWNHEQFGSVSPNEMIPMLERSGYMEEIGLWVIKTAAKQYHEWTSHIQQNIKLMINVSPSQLLKKNFVKNLSEFFTNELPINLKNLVFEFSESISLVTKMSHYEPVLATLEEMGIKSAIDDFGKGYVSLSHLANSPFNILKINIQQLQKNSSDEQSSFKKILDLAKSLNLNLVAKGIEVPEQAALAKQYGIEAGQGYYYSKPLSAPEVTALIER